MAKTQIDKLRAAYDASLKVGREILIEILSRDHEIEVIGTAPDPFVAPYFNFLLDRTARQQRDEPLNYRKDEYPE